MSESPETLEKMLSLIEKKLKETTMNVAMINLEPEENHKDIFVSHEKIKMEVDDELKPTYWRETIENFVKELRNGLVYEEERQKEYNQQKEKTKEIFQKFKRDFCEIIDKERDNFLKNIYGEQVSIFSSFLDDFINGICEDETEFKMRIHAIVAHRAKGSLPPVLLKHKTIQKSFDKFTKCFQATVNELIKKASSPRIKQVHRPPKPISRPSVVPEISSHDLICVGDRGIAQNPKKPGNFAMLFQNGMVQVVEEVTFQLQKTFAVRFYLKFDVGEWHTMNSVSYSPSGTRLLVSGCKNSAIYICDSRNGETIKQWQKTGNTIATPSVSMEILNSIWIDEQRFAAFYDKGFMKVFELAASQGNKEPLALRFNDGYPVSTACTTNQKNQILAGNQIGSVFRYDIVSGSVIWKTKAHKGWVSSLTLSHCQSIGVTCGLDGVCFLIHPENGKLLMKIQESLSPLIQSCFSGRDNYLVLLSKVQLSIFKRNEKGEWAQVKTYEKGDFGNPEQLSTFSFNWEERYCLAGVQEKINNIWFVKISTD